MTDLEKYSKDKATVISILKYILVMGVIAITIFFATKVVMIMIPFLLGFLLAKTSYLIAQRIVPEVNNSQKRKRVSIIIYVILLIAMLIGVIWAGITAITQVINAVKQLTTYLTEFNYSSLNFSYLEEFAEKNNIFFNKDMVHSFEEGITSTISGILNYLPDVITGFVSKIFSAIGNIPYAIFLVISVMLSGYYFLKDTPNILRLYYKAVPNRNFRKKFLSLLNELSITLFNVLGGYLALLIITFAEAYLVFLFAGVKYSAILAIITSLIDFLPVLGVSATMVPLIIYNVLHGNYIPAIILVVGITLMTILRRFLEPLILGKSMKIHPLIMLISMAAGVYIWGAIGFLIGPTVFITLIQIFNVFGLTAKLLNFLNLLLGKVADEESDNTTSHSKKAVKKTK